MSSVVERIRGIVGRPWGLTWRLAAWAALAITLATALPFLARRDGAAAQGGQPINPPSGLPSVRLIQQTGTISPAQALIYYGASGSTETRPRGARIAYLARALNTTRSPSAETLSNIYQFALNSFDFEPQFGLQKGGEGLWLDGAGGAFDHAALVVDLAREAGFQARYVLGEVSLDGLKARSALRVASARQACELLAGGGVPALVNGQTACAGLSGEVASVQMLHVWAEVLVDGSWRALDPSLKTYDAVEGVDLWAALDTSPSGAWSELASGVSESETLISGVDRATLAARLNNRAAVLLNRLRSSDPGSLSNHSIRELTGGWRLAQAATFDSLPTTPPGAVLARWDGDVPDAYRARLTVAAPGFSHAFDLPSVYSERLQAQMAVYAGPMGDVVEPQHFRIWIRRCEGYADVGARDACVAQNTIKGGVVPATWDGRSASSPRQTGFWGRSRPGERTGWLRMRRAISS